MSVVGLRSKLAARAAVVVAIGYALACSADGAGSRRSGAGAGGSVGGAGMGSVAGVSGTDFGNRGAADAGTSSGGSGGAGGTAGGQGGASASLPDGSVGTVCGAAAESMPPAAETCGNGLDDDHNGFVDELCACTPGTTQACFGGRPDLLDLGTCSMGTQQCKGDAEFNGWGACEGWDCGTPTEVCDGVEDEDCDGQIDEGCQLDVPVEIDGDCVVASCPAQAPFPVGCEIEMQGDDPRGCVANTPGQSDVYFQVGGACGACRVVGTLRCSTQMPVGPLDANTCAINKTEPTFGLTRAECAPTGCIEIIPGVCI